jgi:hypothetical protein
MGFTQHAMGENLITLPGVSTERNVTCSSSRFFGCVFSTDSVQSAFEVPPVGDVEESIVLGLQSVGTASNNILVTALVSAFGVDIADLPEPIGSILSILSSQVGGVFPSFSIAAADGFKNGSWIKALDVNTLELMKFPFQSARISVPLRILRHPGQAYCSP